MNSKTSRPWERQESSGLRELAGASTEYEGEKLRRDELRELGLIFEARKREELQWVLDDDLEISDEFLDSEKKGWDPLKRRRGEVEIIRFLFDGFVFWNFGFGFKFFGANLWFC